MYFILGQQAITFRPEELIGRESGFFQDLADGRLSEHTLIDALVIASGLVEESDFITYRSAVYSLHKQALRDLKPYIETSEKDLGNHLLFWLHDHLFKIYDAKANSVKQLLDQGRYNCLTSSLFYALLAKDMGLEVHVYTSSGHVFVKVATSKDNIMVETTVRYGFAPGKKEIARMADEIRYVVVPRKHYDNKRRVSMLELMAALYTNRSCQIISRTPNQEECLVTMPLYKRACALAPDQKEYRQYLLACMHNLALAALRKQDLDQAYCLIGQARNLDMENEDLIDLLETYYTTLVKKAKENPTYGQAITQLEQGLAELPNNRVLLESLEYLYVSQGEKYFKAGDYHQAAQVFRAAWRRLPNSPVISKNFATCLYNLSVRLMEKADFTEALNTCRNCTKLFPENTQCQGLVPIVQINHKITLFNQAVDKYNARAFHKALKLCQQALAIPQVRADLDTRLRHLQGLCKKELE